MKKLKQLRKHILLELLWGSKKVIYKLGFRPQKDSIFYSPSMSFRYGYYKAIKGKTRAIRDSFTRELDRELRERWDGE